MKTKLLLCMLWLGMMSAYAQNKVPNFSVQFPFGFGCDENFDTDDGPDVVGSSSCDNPNAAYFQGGGLAFYLLGGNQSYSFTKRSYANGDGTYVLDGAPFVGPILPASVSGSWVVGGYDPWVPGGNNFIYHAGNFFDPTQGVQTYWAKVITDTRGDAFVLGYAAAGFPTKNAFQPTGSGPLLAEFSGVDSSLVYATYLSSLGLASVSSFAQDKGGNIFLSGNGPLGGVLVKLTPNLPQKIAYRRTLPYLGGLLALDAYSQVYLVAGGVVPIVNAPNPTPSGPGDFAIVVLSPKADRIVYSSYLGTISGVNSAGIGVDGSGNLLLSGTEQDYAWDGRTPYCLPYPIDFNACSVSTYYAMFGPLLRSTLPATLKFSSHRVGTTTVLRLPFKNIGNVPLSVAGDSLSGSSAFTLKNTCVGALKPDATCMISVAFTPTSTGAQTGFLVVSSDSLDSPQTVQLSGTGR